MPSVVSLRVIVTLIDSGKLLIFLRFAFLGPLWLNFASLVLQLELTKFTWRSSFVLVWLCCFVSLVLSTRFHCGWSVVEVRKSVTSFVLSHVLTECFIHAYLLMTLYCSNFNTLKRSKWYEHHKRIQPFWGLMLNFASIVRMRLYYGIKPRTNWPPMWLIVYW